MKVLLIDDNWQARQMIKDYVLSESDVSLECEDGSQALQAYSVFQPDWVLMDWVMKEISGLEATQKILASYPGAKVLIVSSYDAADLRQEAQRAGACGYVQKDDLFELKRILNSSAA